MFPVLPSRPRTLARADAIALLDAHAAGLEVCVEGEAVRVDADGHEVAAVLPQREAAREDPGHLLGLVVEDLDDASGR